MTMMGAGGPAPGGAGPTQQQRQADPGVKQSPFADMPREQLEQLAVEALQRLEELEAMMAQQQGQGPGGQAPQGQEVRGGPIG